MGSIYSLFLKTINLYTKFKQLIHLVEDNKKLKMNLLYTNIRINKIIEDNNNYKTEIGILKKDVTDLKLEKNKLLTYYSNTENELYNINKIFLNGLKLSNLLTNNDNEIIKKCFKQSVLEQKNIKMLPNSIENQLYENILNIFFNTFNKLQEKIVVRIISQNVVLSIEPNES